MSKLSSISIALGFLSLLMIASCFGPSYPFASPFLTMSGDVKKVGQAKWKTQVIPQACSVTKDKENKQDCIEGGRDALENGVKPGRFIHSMCLRTAGGFVIGTENRSIISQCVKTAAAMGKLQQMTDYFLKCEAIDTDPGFLADCILDPFSNSF